MISKHCKRLQRRKFFIQGMAIIVQQRLLAATCLFVNSKRSKNGLGHAEGCQEIQVGWRNSGLPTTINNSNKPYEYQDI